MIISVKSKINIGDKYWRKKSLHMCPTQTNDMCIQLDDICTNSVLGSAKKSFEDSVNAEKVKYVSENDQK